MPISSSSVSRETPPIIQINDDTWIIVLDRAQLIHLRDACIDNTTHHPADLDADWYESFVVSVESAIYGG